MTLTATETTAPIEDPPQETTEVEQPPAEAAPTDAPAPDIAEVAAEVAATTEADDDEPSEEDKSGRKPRNGYKRTIDRQEREIEFLRQQLLRGPQAPAAAPTPKDPADQVKEYIRQEARQLMEEQRQQERQARAMTELQEREAAFSAQHDDYAEAVDTFARSGMPSSHVQVLLTSEHGPAIMYQLAKNPAELARISALPQLDAAREFGRLEAKASVTPPAKTATGKVAVRKSAPAPITPVTARGPTTVKPVSQMSQDEYNAWRDEQQRRR